MREMLRFLIVDDEPNIVEGLYALLIDKYQDKADIIKAFSGDEALSQLMRLPVDILISDIRMPGMSGLEILSWVEGNRPECLVMFLTGYNDFTYAQSALRHKCCVDYLLKTNSDDELIRAIDTHVERILSERTPEKLLIDAEKRAGAMSSRYSDHKPYTYILQHAPTSILDALSIDMSRPTYPLLVQISQQHNGTSETVLAQCLDIAIEKCLPALSQREYVPMDEGLWLWLFQFPSGAKGVLTASAYISTGLQSAQEMLESFGTVGVFIVGKDFRDAKDFAVTLGEMRDVIKSVDNGIGLIIRIEQSTLSGVDIGEDAMIHRVHNYLLEHIGDRQLSLTSIARHTFYNPSYLSRMFKQKTGENLIDYINHLRFERACRLLIEGQLSIQDITKSVGFVSSSYFTMFFRSRSGVTPSEYRRQSC